MTFSVNLNAGISFSEGETYSFTITPDAEVSEATTIRWEIVPLGALPISLARLSSTDGTLNFVMGDTAGKSVSFTAPANDAINYEGHFQIRVYASVDGADEELVSSSETIVLENDVAIDAATFFPIDGSIAPNFFSVATSRGVELNGAGGNDVYIISKYHSGFTKISDTFGVNQVAFDSGVVINEISEVRDSRNSIYAVKLILSTGGVVEVELPSGDDWIYSLGAGEALSYADFKSIVDVGAPYVVESRYAGDAPDAPSTIDLSVPGSANGDILSPDFTGITNYTNSGGDDIYIITRQQYGNVNIEDTLGSNIIKFDAGIEITSFTPNPNSIADVAITLATGAVITITNPNTSAYKYQLGDDELLSYDDLVTEIGEVPYRIGDGNPPVFTDTTVSEDLVDFVAGVAPGGAESGTLTASGVVFTEITPGSHVGNFVIKVEEAAANSISGVTLAVDDDDNLLIKYLPTSTTSDVVAALNNVANYGGAGQPSTQFYRAMLEDTDGTFMPPTGFLSVFLIPPGAAGEDVDTGITFTLTDNDPSGLQITGLPMTNDEDIYKVVLVSSDTNTNTYKVVIIGGSVLTAGTTNIFISITDDEGEFASRNFEFNVDFPSLTLVANMAAVNVEENTQDADTGITFTAIGADEAMIDYKVYDRGTSDENTNFIVQDGVLRVAADASLNFETGETINLDVMARSVNADSERVEITVTLNDVDDAPTITPDVTAAENLVTGSFGVAAVFGTLTASGIVFTEITPSSHVGNFVIKVEEAAANSISGVTLAVDDDDNLLIKYLPTSTTSDVVAALNNVANYGGAGQPSTQFYRAMLEDTDGTFMPPAGFLSAFLITPGVAGTDVDTGFTFTLADEDADGLRNDFDFEFSVDGNDANDRFNAVPVDVSTGMYKLVIVGGTVLDIGTYNVVVTATDAAGLFAVHSFEVPIVPDGPTIIVTGAVNDVFSIDENKEGDTVIMVSGSDATSADITYSIDDTDNFVLSADGGVLQVSPTASLNFETTPTINLTITASSINGVTTQTITINLNDVDDAPTLERGTTSQEILPAGVLGVAGEDVDTGITFMVADEDATGLQNPFNFNIRIGSNDANDRFEAVPVDASTGMYKLVIIGGTELAEGDYDVTITPTDGQNVSTIPAELTLTVAVVPPAPMVSPSASSLTIDENTENADTSITFTPEAGVTLTTENSNFEIVDVAGTLTLRVVAGADLDAEVSTQIDVVIIATSTTTPAVGMETVVITLNDIDDNALVLNVTGEQGAGADLDLGAPTQRADTDYIFTLTDADITANVLAVNYDFTITDADGVSADHLLEVVSVGDGTYRMQIKATAGGFTRPGLNTFNIMAAVENGGAAAEDSVPVTLFVDAMPTLEVSLTSFHGAQSLRAIREDDFITAARVTYRDPKDPTDDQPDYSFTLLQTLRANDGTTVTRAIDIDMDTFSVNSDGFIVVGGDINFETTFSLYTLQISAVDNQMNSTETHEISFRANGAPTLQSAPTEIDVEEDAAAEKVVAEIVISDPEAIGFFPNLSPDNIRATFATPQPGFELRFMGLQGSAYTFALRVIDSTSFDVEGGTTFSNVVINVSDGVNPAFSHTIRVNYVDVDEAPTIDPSIATPETLVEGPFGLAGVNATVTLAGIVFTETAASSSRTEDFSIRIRITGRLDPVNVIVNGNPLPSSTTFAFDDGPGVNIFFRVNRGVTRETVIEAFNAADLGYTATIATGEDINLAIDTALDLDVARRVIPVARDAQNIDTGHIFRLFDEDATGLQNGFTFSTDDDRFDVKPVNVSLGIYELVIKGGSVVLDGTHNVIVTAIDRLGQEAMHEFEVTIHPDAEPTLELDFDSAPLPPLPLESQYDTGIRVTYVDDDDRTPDNTNDNQPTYTFTLNGNLVEDIFSVDSITNQIMIAPNAPLVAGLNTVVIIATDEDGNDNQVTATFTLTNDMVPRLTGDTVVDLVEDAASGTVVATIVVTDNNIANVNLTISPAVTGFEVVETTTAGTWQVRVTDSTTFDADRDGAMQTITVLANDGVNAPVPHGITVTYTNVEDEGPVVFAADGPNGNHPVAGDTLGNAETQASVTVGGVKFIAPAGAASNGLIVGVVLGGIDVGGRILVDGDSTTFFLTGSVFTIAGRAFGVGNSGISIGEVLRLVNNNPGLTGGITAEIIDSDTLTENSSFEPGTFTANMPQAYTLTGGSDHRDANPTGITFTITDADPGEELYDLDVYVNGKIEDIPRFVAVPTNDPATPGEYRLDIVAGTIFTAPALLSLVVRATDKADGKYDDTGPIAFTVAPAPSPPNTPPTFEVQYLADVPENAEGGVVNVPEDVAEAFVIAKFTPEDINGHTVNFRIISGSQNFEIVKNPGGNPDGTPDGTWLLRVRAGATLDHETAITDSITIVASDGTADSLLTETITINITNVDDIDAVITTPSGQSGSYTAGINILGGRVPATLTIGGITFTAPDAGAAGNALSIGFLPVTSGVPFVRADRTGDSVFVLRAKSGVLGDAPSSRKEVLAALEAGAEAGATGGIMAALAEGITDEEAHFIFPSDLGLFSTQRLQLAGGGNANIGTGITFTITDADAGEETHSFRVFVNGVAETITRFGVEATDNDNEYELVIISGTNFNDAGNLQIKVRVIDNVSLRYTDTAEFTLTVDPASRSTAPTLSVSDIVGVRADAGDGFVVAKLTPADVNGNASTLAITSNSSNFGLVDNEDGTWSLVVVSAASLDHTTTVTEIVTIVARDADNNALTSAPINVPVIIADVDIHDPTFTGPTGQNDIQPHVGSVYDTTFDTGITFTINDNDPGDENYTFVVLIDGEEQILPRFGVERVSTSNEYKIVLLADTSFVATETIDLTVRATDTVDGKSVTTNPFTFTVAPPNTAPTIARMDGSPFRVQEDAGIDFIVASFVVADVDKHPVTLRVTFGNSNFETVNNNDGTWSVRVRADASIVYDPGHAFGNDQFIEYVVVANDGRVDSINLNASIRIGDADQGPMAEILVTENTNQPPSGGVVGSNFETGITFEITDDDFGDESYTFAVFVDGAGAEETIKRFDVERVGASDVYQIVVLAGTAFTLIETITLTVRATDNADAKRVTIGPLTFNVETSAVTNIDPTFVVEDASGVMRAVLEDAADGFVIATLTAEDDNEDTVTFEVTSTNSNFEAHLNGDDIWVLRVRADAMLDYETATTESITIVARDGRGGEAIEVITVTIIDVDEAIPTIRDLTMQSETHPEATIPIGTVGTNVATGITFTISGGGNYTAFNVLVNGSASHDMDFAVESIGNGEYQLVVAGGTVFAQAARQSIVIQAVEDSGNVILLNPTTPIEFIIDGVPGVPVLAIVDNPGAGKLDVATNAVGDEVLAGSLRAEVSSLAFTANPSLDVETFTLAYPEPFSIGVYVSADAPDLRVRRGEAGRAPDLIKAPDSERFHIEIKEDFGVSLDLIIAIVKSSAPSGRFNASATVLGGRDGASVGFAPFDDPNFTNVDNPLNAGYFNVSRVNPDTGYTFSVTDSGADSNADYDFSYTINGENVDGKFLTEEIDDTGVYRLLVNGDAVFAKTLAQTEQEIVTVVVEATNTTDPSQVTPAQDFEIYLNTAPELVGPRYVDLTSFSINQGGDGVTFRVSDPDVDDTFTVTLENYNIALSRFQLTDNNDGTWTLGYPGLTGTTLPDFDDASVIYRGASHTTFSLYISVSDGTNTSLSQLDVIFDRLVDVEATGQVTITHTDAAGSFNNVANIGELLTATDNITDPTGNVVGHGDDTGIIARNYQWHRDGVDIAGATDSTVLADVAGRYSVTVITTDDFNETTTFDPLLTNFDVI